MKLRIVGQLLKVSWFKVLQGPFQSHKWILIISGKCSCLLFNCHAAAVWLDCMCVCVYIQPQKLYLLLTLQTYCIHTNLRCFNSDTPKLPDEDHKLFILENRWADSKRPESDTHLVAGDPDKELNPKKKVWEQIQPDLRTDDRCVATYKGAAFEVAGKGVCKAQTMSNSGIK